MRGRIIEVDQGSQLGTVQCTEEQICMSSLRFRGSDSFIVKDNMLGKNCTFDIVRFPGDVRAANIKLVELQEATASAAGEHVAT